MAALVIELRRAMPTIHNVNLVDAVRLRFDCSKQAAEFALTQANEFLHQEFLQSLSGMPKRLFDAYLDLHSEALRAASNVEASQRAGLLNSARASLDSVRDMLGITTPDVVVFSGPSKVDFAEMTDEELAIAARFDRPALAAKAIDVVSAESED